MLVKEYENAQAYLNDKETVLINKEAESQLLLYAAYQNLTATANEKCLFGVIMEADRSLIHFCNVIPNNMAVFAEEQKKDDVSEAAALLADYMASNHVPLTGINARLDICQAFIDQYKKSVNCTFIEKQGMDIMEIRKVNEIKPVDGYHRLAAPEEVKLIADWMVRFQIEAQASDINYETALNKAAGLIEENRLHIYENIENKVVTMAAALKKLPRGTAIDCVYTPEEYRGKGYAAANVYYMSKELLESGDEFCTLFVDKKNPLTSRAYEKVGFHTLEDNYEYKLIPS